jgi:protein phosphatase
MDLKKITQGFAGLLAVGDIHGDIESLIKAHNFAHKNNLFLLSLGDLVDRGPFPFETVQAMLNFVKQGEGGLIRGNHDDKHYRHALGNKVTLSGDAQRTLHAVGEDRLKDFYSIYTELYDHPHTGHYHYLDNWLFAHGASHETMWDFPDVLSSEAKSRALYGQVTGKHDEHGMPERIYEWIDEIPEGKVAVVGHDRKAIYNVKLKTPLMVSNDNGGMAIFTDTSCGKGGILSGVIIKFDHDKSLFERFIQFE